MSSSGDTARRRASRSRMPSSAGYMFAAIVAAWLCFCAVVDVGYGRGRGAMDFRRSCRRYGSARCLVGSRSSDEACLDSLSPGERSPGTHNAKQCENIVPARKLIPQPLNQQRCVLAKTIGRGRRRITSRVPSGRFQALPEFSCQR